MSSASTSLPSHETPWIDENDRQPSAAAIEVITWLGHGKGFIAWITGGCLAASVAAALLSTPIYTARTTLLPPGSQQQSSSANAIAALGQLGGALGSSLNAKTPDELYVALLKSDSVLKMLDDRLNLRQRYEAATFTSLRRKLPQYVRISSDKKSGLITVEVDDKDPAFSAELANGHTQALTQLMGRLAVGEAQQRRVFFEQQLKDTKESLIQAEQNFRKIQESSGVIVLDKQAEALIGSAASLRAQIAAREVQMKVLRTGATEQNPEVVRLSSELRALRTELSRLESNTGSTGTAPSAGPGGVTQVTDMPVGKIPEAAIDFVRARRELKLQETLLESMVRQYEIAKLDEAKEGPMLQQIDIATVPDARSKPARSLIVLMTTGAALLLSSLWVILRQMIMRTRNQQPQNQMAWQAMRSAWRRKKNGKPNEGDSN